MTKLSVHIVVVVALASLLVCGARADPITFRGELNGTSEVPSVQSPGRGTVTATFDPASRSFSWVIVYSGLPDAPIAIHFYGPADASRNAGIIVPVTGNFASPIRGAATLSEGYAAMLVAGQFYLNIHTVAHPAGEIRGQVIPEKKK